MSRRRIGLAVLAAVLATAQAQNNDFATGNMHFDAKDMDSNGDHMVTRAEMQQYAEKLWEMMAHGKTTIPIEVSVKDFASAGVNFSARAIDTDHDGSISKEEFLAYTGKKYDGMKKTRGMVPVEDMAKAFARGNVHLGTEQDCGGSFICRRASRASGRVKYKNYERSQSLADSPGAARLLQPPPHNPSCAGRLFSGVQACPV